MNGCQTFVVCASIENLRPDWQSNSRAPKKGLEKQAFPKRQTVVHWPSFADERQSGAMLAYSLLSSHVATSVMAVNTRLPRRNRCWTLATGSATAACGHENALAGSENVLRRVPASKSL